MGNRVNPQVKLTVIRRDGFKCIYCKTIGTQKNYLTVDHIFPLSKGGTNRQKNIACSCRECNQKKKNMLLTDFIKKYGIEINREIASFL